jgi:hypothetical protein
LALNLQLLQQKSDQLVYNKFVQSLEMKWCTIKHDIFKKHKVVEAWKYLEQEHVVENFSILQIKVPMTIFFCFHCIVD